MPTEIRDECRAHTPNLLSDLLSFAVEIQRQITTEEAANFTAVH